MRLPRVRFTVRRMMIAVAVAALTMTSCIYIYRIYGNWRAYAEWAADTSPNRPFRWPVPYP
jgi:hypothetical protein